jgi:hypothetical protein
MVLPWLLQIRLGLALIGVALFGYGIRVNDDRLRWIGIGFLAASALIRSWRRRPPPPTRED